jgi:hypothetical protein
MAFLIYIMCWLVVSLILSLFGYKNTLIQRYNINLWLALDRTLNTILGGDSRETMSSRAGKAMKNGHPFAATAIDWVAEKVFKDYNHCKKNIETYSTDHSVL